MSAPAASSRKGKNALGRKDPDSSVERRLTIEIPMRMGGGSRNDGGDKAGAWDQQVIIEMAAQDF